jgi:hypothetical protein
LDICTSVHQAFSEPEPIALSAHDVAVTSPSGPCGPTGELLALLDSPRSATMAENRFWARIGGEPVIVAADGPGGSGRYWTVHLVQRGGHACLGGTTLAWRHLYRATDALEAQGLVPLPILADVDRDGTHELVLFRGPSVNPEWGNAGVVLAMPALTLADGRWVWDERASRHLAGRLAAVYGALAAEPGAFGPAAEVAEALRRFADGRACGG